MADKGPDYRVERLRLEVQRDEHELTIQKGESRLLEIERQKRLNTRRAEIANADLDSEADKIRTNNEALTGAIEEIDSNLSKMVKA